MKWDFQREMCIRRLVTSSPNFHSVFIWQPDFPGILNPYISKPVRDRTHPQMRLLYLWWDFHGLKEVDHNILTEAFRLTEKLYVNRDPETQMYSRGQVACMGSRRCNSAGEIKVEPPEVPAWLGQPRASPAGQTSCWEGHSKAVFTCPLEKMQKESAP